MKDDKIVGILALTVICIVALVVLGKEASNIVLASVGAIGGSITGDIKRMVEEALGKK